ncbi:MAG: hypothetical protein EOM50_04335 [Erysipelotrichia bacterium]|nr:hypothetical protein [Erysipelotrichia bacterium]NCC54459.1 hypothetical protein [Erysipelotrichia bacterium]
MRYCGIMQTIKQTGVNVMIKKLGVGVDNYRKLIEKKHYYVDKTLLIEDFMKDGSEVSLITRPRRFGKTLNMSMLAEFFDISKDSQAIFAGMHIMQSEYATLMNQYPVIFLSFKDVKGKDKDTLIKELFTVLYNGYFRYYDQLTKNNVNKDLNNNIQYMYHLLNAKGVPDKIAISECNNSLILMSQFLYEYYGKKVMLFIDEYDTPFIEAYNHTYYEEVHDILASLLSKALKGNEYLEKAMITGIQRIAKENIFSGLNNLSVCTVSDDEYANYFGLNEEETKILLQYYDLSLSEEVKAMYDGYRIGGLELYNPWSIINYAQEKKLIPYWVNTASNMMIKNMISLNDENFKQDYEDLIVHGEINVNADLETSYFEEASDKTLWALLINAGYLTIIKANKINNYCICIPNNEVKEVFKDLSTHYLRLDERNLSRIDDALRNQEFDLFIQSYQKFIIAYMSYYDALNENSFHSLMLGLCAYMYNTHEVISNREMGKGRCDIVLRGVNANYASYILEFKYTKDKKIDLKEKAKEALKQIIDEKYDTGLKGEVYYIGLGHRGKEVEIVYQKR